MRYYSIQILEPDGTQFALFTSLVNGKTDLGALQVEFDIPVTTLATPIGAASVKIWGVPLSTIGQASDFNGKLMKVFAGMQKGLPLANPAQAGLILQGSINQAFGNWIGNNQWVEFVVVTDGAMLGEQLNITLSWKKGVLLSTAIEQTLAVAAPDYSVTTSISENLVLGADEHGYYTSMLQFAQYLKTVSAAIIGGAYQGVDVLIADKTFKVFDGTTPTDPFPIDFNDLIGQPTWIDPGTIQVTTVMRADLEPTDYIRLPPGQVTTSAASQSQYRDKSVFQGAFMINEMRHIGNFRQADALAWITVMNCSPSVPVI